MAPSPQTGANGALRVSLQANGNALPDTLQLLSLQVRHAVNDIPWARVVIRDGDITSGKFDVADSALLAPGVELSIALGYGEREQPVFSGVVVRCGVRLDEDGLAALEVECRDQTAAMTVGRRARAFADQSDSAVIGALLSEHGLQADVQPTRLQHRALVQPGCSDWDFLLARAGANGLVVLVADGKASVKPPATDAEPALTVTWGTDLLGFDARIDAHPPFAGVAAGAQDPCSPVRMRGRMRFQGSARALPGALLEVAGLGTRFSGKVYAGAVQHEVHDGNWLTEVEIGLDPAWLLTCEDAPAPPAEDDPVKTLVTGRGHTLELNDDENTVTLKTPEGNQVVLSDQHKCITLSDRNGNTVTLDSRGIRLYSAGDLVLSAQGKVTVSAISDIELAATGDLKAGGLNVQCDAQVGFKAQGNATAELSASGQTTVQGAIVMIN